LTAPGRHRFGRLWVAALLVAGVPLAITLLTFLREIIDLSVLTRTNPLQEVASSLVQRVDLRLAEAGAKMRAVAGDPSAHDAGLAVYAPFVENGPFAAVSVTHARQRSLLPAGTPLADDPVWEALPEDGFSPLRFLADGRPVVAVVVTGEGGRKAVGMVDLERLLGHDLVDRMRLARWGEVFIAAPDGRIFLSARRELVGRRVTDLGLRPVAGAEGVWRDGNGTDHWVGLADATGAGSAARGWRVGLTVPETVQATRNRGTQTAVWAIIGAVLTVTAGLLAVFLHSLRGPARESS